MTWTILQQQPSSGAAGFLSLVPVLIIAVIFYLLIFLPMRKRQKKLEEMIRNLKNGDRIITNAGIHGTIAGIKESTFLLKVAEQVKIEISKNAVASLQPPEEH
ncbi:MAG: preprotein translocase subunit YajC [Acidobacteria bacterium]|nr:preprotein translocase subunit YajC [Acidobacteriota bacterium]